VVHFGEHWPRIHEGVIEELRRTVGSAELHILATDSIIKEGDERAAIFVKRGSVNSPS